MVLSSNYLHGIGQQNVLRVLKVGKWMRKVAIVGLLRCWRCLGTAQKYVVTQRTYWESFETDLGSLQVLSLLTWACCSFSVIISVIITSNYKKLYYTDRVAFQKLQVLFEVNCWSHSLPPNKMKHFVYTVMEYSF